MDDDTADRSRFLEAHRLPGQPAVGRFENAAARRDRVARVLFAGARPHLRRVGWCDRQLAHRDAGIIVEDRPERRAGIRRLPDSARRCRHEEGFRRTRDAGDARHAPAHVRGSNVAPAQAGEECRVERDPTASTAHPRRDRDIARRWASRTGQRSLWTSRGGGVGGLRCWVGRWSRGILGQKGCCDGGEDGQRRPRAREHDGLS